MTRPVRWGRSVPWLVGAGAALYAVQIGLAVAYGIPEDFGDALLVAILAGALAIWGGIGWLIATRRPQNALSAVMGGEAFLLGVASFTSFVASRWPDTSIAPLFNNLQGLLVPLLLAVPLILLIFPTGSPATRRWNVVLWLMAVSVLTGMIGMGLAPSDDIAWSPLASVLASIAGLTGVAAAFSSIAACIVRFRRSRGDERQQMRWLVLLALLGGAFFLTLLVSNLFDRSGDNPVANMMWVLLMLTISLGLPTAVGIAVLRYRLYDIDVVIRKTVVVAVVAFVLTSLYVAVLAVATLAPVSRAAIALLLLAITFNPVRRAAHGIADRVAYGRRASSYEVLSDFSERIAETYASDDVLARMASVLASGTGATTATVWLRVGTELRPVAAAGDAPEAPAALTLDANERPVIPGDAVEIRHGGELLGALSVVMPANDPLDHAREKLVHDMAAQAGLVLRNARLIEELRASRQRLVAAQDEERRKIERNLHDGVQQQLVALNVQLGLLAKVAEREPTKAGDMATGLQSLATTALEDLRDLARGIYPPLLADKGLAAALEAQARKAAVPTSVECDGAGRYGRDVEAAVYFCVLEALNNVAKYANATAATVRLAHEGDRLSFSVTDDGEGFDATMRRSGTGLQGMADRLDAIGASLAVRSEPGSGTTVTGIVPV